MQQYDHKSRQHTEQKVSKNKDRIVPVLRDKGLNYSNTVLGQLSNGNGLPSQSMLN